MPLACQANGPRNFRNADIAGRCAKVICGPPLSRFPFERLQTRFSRIVVRTSGWSIVTLWGNIHILLRLTFRLSGDYNVAGPAGSLSLAGFASVVFRQFPGTWLGGYRLKRPLPALTMRRNRHTIRLYELPLWRLIASSRGRHSVISD